MFCRHCGQQIEDDSRFCRYCGGCQNEASEPASDVQSAPEIISTQNKSIKKSNVGLIVTIVAILLFVIRVTMSGSSNSPLDSVDQGSANGVAVLDDMTDTSGTAGEGDLFTQATPPAPVDPWSYSTDQDKIRGGMSYFASVTSTNSVPQDAPYDSATLRLLVRKSPAHGTDVLVILSSGQLICPSYEGCYGTVRFDSGSAQRLSFSGAADHSSDTIFIDGARNFIAKMKKAQKLVLEVELYQAGRPQFEFDVHGLKWEH